MVSQSNGSGSQSTVVIAEHDPDGAELLRTLFELDGRFAVVAVVTDLAPALASVAELRPTAVVLDLELDDENDAACPAVAAIHRASPDSRVVVLSAFPDPCTLLEVLAQGAAGYLDATRSWSEMVPVVAELCA